MCFWHLKSICLKSKYSFSAWKSFCKSKSVCVDLININLHHEIFLKLWFPLIRNPGPNLLWNPSCMHFACTVAFLNVGNNLSIKVLGYWVTLSKYLCLIVRLHKSNVMLGAWAASALAWCYFQTSLVMPTRIFGLLHIKFRAVSATSPQSPSREKNKEDIKSYFRRGNSVQQCSAAWWLILNSTSKHQTPFSERLIRV